IAALLTFSSAVLAQPNTPFGPGSVGIGTSVTPYQFTINSDVDFFPDQSVFRDIHARADGTGLRLFANTSRTDGPAVELIGQNWTVDPNCLKFTVPTSGTPDALPHAFGHVDPGNNIEYSLFTRQDKQVVI